MIVSDDIVVFIRARLDEDEQAARAATAGPWRYNPAKQWLNPPELAMPHAVHRMLGGEEFVGSGPLNAANCVALTGPRDDPAAMSDAAHIARHDPARVLLGVQAKRAILGLWNAPDHLYGGYGECYGEVVHLLASEWSTHPDYQQEWTP
jgi:hypothetical protein